MFNRATEILKLTPLKLSGIPPPMAHCEVLLDSNIVAISFSLSGSRIAVLTRDNFSVFIWSLRRPVTAPLLESSYPLPKAVQCRPRQIAFLNDNEVYVLNHHNPSCRQVERTVLESCITTTVYKAAETERLHSIFANLDHRKLWLSRTHQSAGLISYATIIPTSSNNVAIADWDDGLHADTVCAEATEATANEVRIREFLIYKRLKDR
jgi:elongator complex protein 1